MGVVTASMERSRIQDPLNKEAGAPVLSRFLGLLLLRDTLLALAFASVAHGQADPKHNGPMDCSSADAGLDPAPTWRGNLDAGSGFSPTEIPGALIL